METPKYTDGETRERRRASQRLDQAVLIDKVVWIWKELQSVPEMRVMIHDSLRLCAAQHGDADVHMEEMSLILGRMMWSGLVRLKTNGSRVFLSPQIETED